ncbi:MAG: flagellar basal body-associated FliL family protein [Lachnospiraceae bacterium]|jgi:flagellar FliL protein|nr:flagellar basal body-associated FliL family protein [Lachnospiraceae bacterium]
MKKNLFSIIIIALLFVNLAFTGFLAFTIIPAASKSNELITKVCGAIDLEIEDLEGSGMGGVTIADLEVVDIEDDLTINLKKGADGKDHIAVLGVALSLNTKHEDYSKLSGSVTGKTSLIKDTIRSTISQFTIEDMQDSQDKVLETLLSNLRKLFGSTFIVQVHFRSAIYQ